MMTVTLGGAAAFLSFLLALYLSLWSPWARVKRNNRRVREERDQQIYEALYGHPEVRDDSNALIKAAQPGLLAEMRLIRYEFPINGVPTRILIDEINRKVHENYRVGIDERAKIGVDLKKLTNRFDQYLDEQEK